MLSPEPNEYSDAEQRLILATAWDALKVAAATGRSLRIEIARFPKSLRQVRATFVTLRADQELRGCIGCLEGREPLIQSVAKNTHAAALDDPRFPAVSAGELDSLSLTVSILSVPVIRSPRSEAALLELLATERPGLILTAGHRRATFLPEVWEQLSDPADFLRELKRKAGLGRKEWPGNLEISTYRSVLIGPA